MPLGISHFCLWALIFVNECFFVLGMYLIRIFNKTYVLFADFDIIIFESCEQMIETICSLPVIILSMIKNIHENQVLYPVIVKRHLHK